MVVSAERYADERLHGWDRLRVNRPTPNDGVAADGGDNRPAPGDDVVLVAGTHPQLLFGLGEVQDSKPAQPGRGDLAVGYRRRLFEVPVQLDTALPMGISPLTGAEYAGVCAHAGAPAILPRWLVSVSLPIEASSPAEAVREFWSYVDSLGARELPAFVSPAADEFAMQAFVLGAEANLDPEEE